MWYDRFTKFLKREEEQETTKLEEPKDLNQNKVLEKSKTKEDIIASEIFTLLDRKIDKESMSNVVIAMKILDLVDRIKDITDLKIYVINSTNTRVPCYLFKIESDDFNYNLTFSLGEENLYQAFVLYFFSKFFKLFEAEELYNFIPKFKNGDYTLNDNVTLILNSYENIILICLIRIYLRLNCNDLVSEFLNNTSEIQVKNLKNMLEQEKVKVKE